MPPFYVAEFAVKLVSFASRYEFSVIRKAPPVIALLDSNLTLSYRMILDYLAIMIELSMPVATLFVILVLRNSSKDSFISINDDSTLILLKELSLIIE